VYTLNEQLRNELSVNVESWDKLSDSSKLQHELNPKNDMIDQEMKIHCSREIEKGSPHLFRGGY